MKLSYKDPNSGKQKNFSLKKGQVIGRKNTDITIRDEKISTRHAKVSEAEGKFKLVDLGSTNKIIVKGKSYQEIDLVHGIEFYLGSVLFKAVDPSKEKAKKEKLKKEEAEFEEDRKKKRIKSNRHWSDLIGDRLPQLAAVAEQKNIDVYPFLKSAKLSIISGPDKGIIHDLCYGPRSFGNLNSDITVYDWNINEAQFQIVEHDKNIYLTTDFPAEVLVNGNSQKTVKLSTGDRIELGQSIIEVEISE